jgi:hypothetical protein
VYGDVLHDFTIGETWRVYYKWKELLNLREPMGSPWSVHRITYFIHDSKFILDTREHMTTYFIHDSIFIMDTIEIPSERPEAVHTHLNPTCYYVVNMNFEICQTSKTVTNHIATKQLADANMASPSSLDISGMMSYHVIHAI